MTALDKAREVKDKLKAEVKAEKAAVVEKKEEATKELATRDYSQYANMGMKNIDAEDIMPPMAFLVQGIDNKSELVDSNGNECPDGSFIIKSLGEVFNEVEGYVVYISKSHYKGKDGPDPIWEATRVYKTVFVRKSDMMPIAITFKKSSQNAVSNLLTASKSKNQPVFMFKVTLKVVTKTSKMGKTYFASVLNVNGLERDVKTLDKLFKLSSGFNSSDEVATEEETLKAMDADTDERNAPEADKNGEIPF